MLGMQKMNNGNKYPGIMLPTQRFEDKYEFYSDWEYPVYKFTSQRVDAVEYGVGNYPVGLEGWRMYRLEYGGHAENCVKECVIWLPPNLDVTRITKIINEYANSGHRKHNISKG